MGPCPGSQSLARFTIGARSQSAATFVNCKGFNRRMERVDGASVKGRLPSKWTEMVEFAEYNCTGMRLRASGRKKKKSSGIWSDGACERSGEAGG